MNHSYICPPKSLVITKTETQYEMVSLTAMGITLSIEEATKGHRTMKVITVKVKVK